MFFRRKAVGERRYLQIVESRRDGSSVRQQVVATLGRAEDWLDGGKLDQLLQSGARLSETALVLSALRDGDGLVVDSRRLGPTLIFDRLWRETGCQAVIEGLLAERRFQFPVERAIFASVLHRLCISGSDRACDKWLEGYRVAGLDGIDLHHLYRAIAWLGEELADQEGRTRAPRAIKDLVEERLFARRRDLFNDLDLVFFDTSALYFHGEGGETLGRRGKSKDHRPELKQVVIGVVIDRHGRPLCSETWPGNATDVQALLPVIDRLRARFCIGRICVVADRGMISARTLAELDERGIEYILGTRERNDAEVRETVLADTTGMVPLSIPKAAGTTTDIEVKEVLVRPWDGKGKPRRYIVCYNPERAAWEAAQRTAIIAALQEQLSRGDKSLVGNSGFRKFLKVVGDDHFALDEAKVAEEAKLDGFYVLRTNSKRPTLEVAMRYRELWKVEQNLPHHQGRARNAAGLSRQRRRHPRPPVLQLPGAGAAQGIAGPAAGGRTGSRVAGRHRRPRPRRRDHRRTAGTSLRAAQPSARLCRSSVPGRWRRPAAPVPTPRRRKTRRAHRPAQPETPQAPPHTPQA